MKPDNAVESSYWQGARSSGGRDFQRQFSLRDQTTSVLVDHFVNEVQVITMTPVAHLSCLLFIGALTFNVTVLADHLDHDSVKRLRDDGRILSMSEVMRRAARIQPGQLLEAELDRDDGRYVYEIRILDATGRVHELELDAASGVLIESSYDD